MTPDIKLSLESTIEVDGEPHVFETIGGDTYLKKTHNTTPSEDQAAQMCTVPKVWVITRKRGVPLFALKPKQGDLPFRILSADALYAEKIQWFEPLAINYREIIWINPEALYPTTQAGEAFKHFTWQQIIEFAIVDRMSIMFSSYMPGDWKFVSAGGDRYLMVLVEGKPYWADAVGQIPFATDTFRLFYEKSADKDSAIIETINTGIKYGDGNPAKPEEDRSNKYDNYMVMRGAIWASENFQRITSKRVIHGHTPVVTDQTITKYMAVSDSRLRRAGNAGELAKYGVWDR